MKTDKSETADAIASTRSAHDKLKYMRECISDRDIEAIQRKAIELAKAGNLAAARLCHKQIAGQRRGVPVKCELPPLRTAGDVLAAMQIVANNVSAGKLTPAEGADLAKIFDLFLQALGHLDLEKRMTALEEQSIPKKHPQ